MQMFNQNPDPSDVSKAKEALKVQPMPSIHAVKALLALQMGCIPQGDWNTCTRALDVHKVHCCGCVMTGCILACTCHLERVLLPKSIVVWLQVMPDGGMAGALTGCLCEQNELNFWEGYTKGGYVAGSQFTLAGETQLHTTVLPPAGVPL